MALSQTLNKYLHFTWQNSAFYRSLYTSHGIAEGDLDQIQLQDLPIVTKRMVRDNYNEIVTDPRIRSESLEKWLDQDHDPRSRYLGEFLVIHSSGSSGSQANMVYDDAAWRSMTGAAAAYLYPGIQTGGTRYRNAFYIGDRGHVASATTAMNSSQAAFDCLIVSMKDSIEETVAQLNAFQPNRLTGYSSSMGWLAELALTGKLRISPQDVVTSSDRMTPAVEAKICQAWNPNIYDIYAAVESLFIAVKQPGLAEWKVLDELQRIEVLDAKNKQVGVGEIGRVVLTSWTNRTLPLIRYDLTDYVICGETQPGKSTLRGFAGRSFDNLPIRLADGQAGEISSFVLAKIGDVGLEAFQFISHSPDEVLLQYCATEDMDGLLQVRMAELLAEWGGTQTKFSICRVDHIWNDAATLKVKLVRRPNDLQIGLPQQIMGSIPVEMSDEKLRQGGGFVPFDRGFLDKSLAEVFERQVMCRPEAIALKNFGRQLTYAELNRDANQVANGLIIKKLAPFRPVALLFTHKAAMVVAMLAVIKIGGCYVPLDPSHPAARNMAILKEIGVKLVLTDSESLASARAYGFIDEQIINLDEPDLANGYANPGVPISPDSSACILYTSGSTGQPKGVVLNQRAVLHRVLLYTNDYAIGPGDRMALLQSYVFNASVREIYAALLNGAGLYIYSLKQDGVHHLAEWLEEEGISVLYMVPAVWRVFLDTLQGQKFERLRLVRLGGDAVLGRDLEGFQRHFGPECILANGLAATETGTICQYFMSHQTRIGGSQAPAGFAVQDKEVCIVDDEGRPVENGATGEIVVSSDYLGPGYFSPGGPPLGRLLDTRRVIHTGDLGYRLGDGRIMLSGRKDWQVKLRGQRMNMVEIEQALLSLENVADAAVILQAREEGTPFLAAFIQAETQPAPGEDALRRGLRDLLPEAMVPTAFQFLEILPRTMSGKIDRLALPTVEPQSDGCAFTESQPACESPKTPTELALAEIWQTLLGIEAVSADDNFFTLGGDSLQASIMMAKIEARFERKFPLSILFQHKTLRGFGREIDAWDQGEPDRLMVTIQPKGEKPPVFFFTGIDGDVLGLRELTVNLGSDHPLYGLEHIDYGESPANLKTLEQAAEVYARKIRGVSQQGPYLLVGYSFGGHLAIETARLLAGENEPECLVVLIDTYPAQPVSGLSGKQRVQLHLNNLRELNGTRQVIGYFLEGLQRLYHLHLLPRLTRFVSRERHMQVGKPVSSMSMALKVYKPQPYSGRVVLFKASHKLRWYLERDPRDDWKDFISSEIDLRDISGEHFDLIKPPLVYDLAHRLKEVLG